jgi:hypothetical protein
MRQGVLKGGGGCFLTTLAVCLLGKFHHFQEEEEGKQRPPSLMGWQGEQLGNALSSIFAS